MIARMISDEGRMSTRWPGCKPEALGFATGDFQHRQRRFLAADDVERMRRGLFDDLLDAALRVDEHHVERDVGVLHPHAHWLRAFVHKQHAAHRGQRAHEHEALRLAPRAVRQPDLESVFHLLAVGDLELAARKCGQVFERPALGDAPPCLPARGPSAATSRRQRARRRRSGRCGFEVHGGHRRSNSTRPAKSKLVSNTRSSRDRLVAGPRQKPRASTR